MMMKHKYLLPLLLSCSLSAFSQGTVRLFAFSQENSPGMVKTGTDENGRELKQNKVKPEYFIYLSARPKDRIQPVEIWIAGKPFSVNLSTVSKTPLTRQINKHTVTLVPRTTNTVLEITPGPERSITKFTSAQKKAADNEIVVVYKLNGKFYSATVKKTTRLEPELNE